MKLLFDILSSSIFIHVLQLCISQVLYITNELYLINNILKINQI